MNMHPTARQIKQFLEGDEPELVIAVNDLTAPGIEQFLEHVHSNVTNLGELQFRELLKTKAEY